MDRTTWIERCAQRLSERGIDLFCARNFAITEFNLRCREEPMDGSPERPLDQWPEPEDAAEDELREWNAQQA